MKAHQTLDYEPEYITCICGQQVVNDYNFCPKCGFDFSFDLESCATEDWDYNPNIDLSNSPRIYIAGNMRYHKNFRYKDFFETAIKLKKEGFIVFNPAVHPLGLSLKEFMQLDMLIISMCTHIYMLKGWEGSKGAVAEHQYAEMLGHTIIYEEV